ncbi:hypothetical protein C9J12_28755 [Photobacterium frigidiphilum]|uniref:Uncharacterized protein n=1 Tax=Photobacterium frigidiphilum TaxID=264736 RepID=A0A2T3J633_9GAMM|nr:hypothetical protein [Photobacterium frigidiphilum]PSU42622.1 hypothetical protein C9J12_28755 [Photobacterium frigidiphilum]
MAKTYFPNSEKTIRVVASEPHPTGTKYKISMGIEIWGGDTGHEVIKIQMEYNDVVSGRRSPSYPIGTDDYKRVMEAVNSLS